MNRTQNRLLLFVFSFFLINLTFSQTLYWVGGSGNFNDPKHWSLTSGGSSSNLIPSSDRDVIIDDNSGGFNVTINIPENAQVRSLNAINKNNRVSFTGTKFVNVNVSGSFVMNPATSWDFEGSLSFVSSSETINEITFGIENIKSDLKFNQGKYKISNVFQASGAKTYFNNGTYIFKKTSLSVNNLFISGANTSFVIDTASFLVKNKLSISDRVDFNTNKFTFYAPFSDPSRVSIPAGMNFGNVTKIGDNSTMAVCDATIRVVPECSGSCSGIFSYTLDPSCASGPYSLSVSNGSLAVNCQNTANNLSLINIPMTGTVAGACDCPGSQYNIVILDGSGFPIPGTIYINGGNTTNFNFNPPSFSLPTLGSKAPSCNASCNGTLSLVASGGFGPYTITVLPAVAGPFLTAGGFTVGGLCANVYTFTITDKNGCSGVITKTVVAPAVVSTGSVTTNEACFGACTGSLVILPSGGNPGGYTVNFSPPGGTFTVPAAGSASVTGLCPGAISATVTDSKGCFITTSTVITQPPQLTVTPTQTNLSCFSICNGAASVAVSGGVAPYNYVWTPGPGATNSLTSLCSGTQIVTVLDNNGCANIKTFTITSPPAITLTLTQKNITCNALCNGAATVQAAGGTGAITFTWTGPAPFVTSNAAIITNLCPGVYTLTAQDALNCPATQTINITQPSPATITANVTNNTCFSSCAGSATVSIVGGNGAPFGYIWTPGITVPQGQGTAILNSLCQGSYTLAATDASACPISTVITITQPTSITPNAIITNVTCNAACNGSVTTAPVGGSGGPYTITLVTPTSATLVPPFINLCAGVYTLSVKDVSACVSTSILTITQPNPLVPSINTVAATCFTVCNGSLAGSVLGGTPGYTLTWNTPSGPAAGGNLINQCAGNYTFFVTDANQCTVALTTTLTQPADITTTLNATNPLCNTFCNGSIGVNIAGGTPGYTLNWSSGSGNPNVGLCAGNYSLLIQDANGCTKQVTTALVAPPAFTVAVNTTSTSCAGTCDGSATVTAAGGTGLITYQFNTIPATINNTGIISGLCAGAYIVSITDANGCTTSQAFNISSPPLLTAAITGIVPTCNVCTGASTVTVAGGTPGYTVNWTNSASATVAIGTTASNLCLGNYTANVVDSKGCTANAVVNIPNTVSVTIITGASPILCYGACNASATANAIGGMPTYTYTWNSIPSQTAQTATGLCAGAYTVTVVDANLCSNTASVLITQPTSVTVNSTQTNIACFAGCNGAITTTVSGGTPAYTYSWSPGGQTTPSLSALCTGNYTLNVKDLNNCSQTFTYAIAQNPSLTASFTSTNPSGCALNNGTIIATASGGVGPYLFTWSPAVTSFSASPTTTATGLGAGSYSLFIQDQAGCTASLSTNLSSPSGPTVNVTTASVSCFGQSTGAATAIAIGTGPFTFAWSPATTSAVVGATTTATGLSAGNYNINVTDMATGCLTSQTLNIATPSSATITSNVVAATCSMTCNGSISTTVTGGTPGYIYSWLPAAPPITGQGTGTVTGLCAGNFTLNLTDNNGCASTKSFVITQPSSLSVTATQNSVTCFSFSNAAISLTTTGGTAPYSYSWSAVGSFTGSTNSTINNIPVGVYTATITDLNGCSIPVSYTISQPSALGHTIITTNLTCNSSCIGTASQVVPGGTSPYSFSWSSTAATTQNINSLCAGNYTGTVIDANGCTSSLPFVITQPAAISVNAIPTSPLCNTQCNGSITTTVTGGNGGYVYTWSPAGAGANPTGLCANVYTLTVTDASLCIGNAIVTLTNPPAVQANVTFTNPLCSAGCNGIATSNPLNTTAPVSYTWTSIPNQVTQTASGLCAGTYSVFISDFNGCTDVQQVTLSSPPAITINPSTFPATCGFPTGSISIAISGGTPVYTILWTPGSATTTALNNIFAGIYTVSVTDANGCNNTVSIPLSNSNGPTAATINQTNVNCFGQCTGAAAVISATGGTLPYQPFSWVVPPSATTVNPQSNLCAGNYTAQIKDANNCLLFQSITITQNPAIADNAVITDAICNGVCSGSIVLTPTGGVAPYAYTWSPSTSTISSATGLCVGVHTATITDALLCPQTFVYAINGQTVLTSAIASTNNICFGNCLGTSSATAGGGLAPYTYSWSNTQTGPLANNLCNGTYSLFVTDNNGCKNTFMTTIVSPNAITLNAAISSPSCGMCNGSSTVNVAGGTPVYTYTWSSGGTAASESSLCAGLYQVLVTDLNGCSQVLNVPVSNSSGITGETFSVQDETCFSSCNGSVSVTPIGGTPGYTYSWINPVSTNSFITNLCGGTYFVQMTDAQGCIRTSGVNVNSAVNLSITTSVISPSCNGGTNGVITASASGGTGIYTYTWLPAGTGATLSNVSAGIYTLSVFDGVCTKTTAVTVNNTNSPVLFSTVTDNGCAGMPCIGSVVLIPSLGTPGYSYNWSNGNTTNAVNGLCQGIITVTVTDNALCQVVQSFNINQNPAMNLSLPVVTQVKCNNDCTGSINVIPNGGTIPYVYTWNPATAVVPANPLNNLCTGTYTSIITDAKGCSITSTIDLVNPPAFTVTAIKTDATCNSSTDGSATITVNGATPAYTYSWSGPATATTQNISNVAPGSYSLTIIDANGCQKDTTLDIAAGFIVIAKAGNDTTFCANNTLVLDGSNSTNAASYSWSLAPVTSIANTSITTIIPPIGTSTYVLLVTSANVACFDDDTVVVTVNPLPPIDAGPSQSISLLSTTSIGGNPTSATALTYTWMPSSTLDNPNIPNPVASNSVNTIYTVMVTDANGCVNTSTVEIDIYPEIKIPNGFSPNSDGKNDVWMIDNINQFPNCIVEVYNRWGELLFHSKGYGTPFDGKYNGKDLPVGTYYYVIEMNHSAYTKPYTGPLTIFR